MSTKQLDYEEGANQAQSNSNFNSLSICVPSIHHLSHHHEHPAQ